MKKISILIIFMIFASELLVFSQKNEIGLNFGMGQYKNSKNVFANHYTYENNLFNSGVSEFLYFNGFIKESNYFLSAGIKLNEFQNYQTKNNLTINCINEVFKVPIVFFTRKKLTDFVSLDFGIGIYSGILKKQYQVLPDNTISEFGFASYTNFGITASGYLLYIPNDKGGFKIGLNSDYDLAKISSKNENVIVNSYSFVTIELGLFLKLRK